MARRPHVDVDAVPLSAFGLSDDFGPIASTWHAHAKQASLGEAPSIEDAARRAGLSTRTLERRFADEAQTSWRRFLHQARMMRAMELLDAPLARVTETALAVGFESHGAFTRAFTEFAGENPKDFRSRKRSATP